MTLQAIDLAVGYSGRTVGRDFTLALKPGEVLALLGPNGGGKTTLLKTLLGLLPPKGGQVLIDGRSIAEFSAAQRARLLAYVPQAAASSFAFSVRDMVLMGRTAHGSLFSRPSRSDFEATEQAIDKMGIASLADQPVTMISGGERQLTLIARALAQQARFVVLDEPTASLDFGNQGRVLDVLAQLGKDGLGVLFSTHDPNHALRCAHRALLVARGGLLASGVVSEALCPALLAELYGSPVSTLVDKESGRAAYLPG